MILEPDLLDKNYTSLKVNIEKIKVSIEKSPVFVAKGGQSDQQFQVPVQQREKIISGGQHKINCTKSNSIKGQKSETRPLMHCYLSRTDQEIQNLNPEEDLNPGLNPESRFKVENLVDGRTFLNLEIRDLEK